MAYYIMFLWIPGRYGTRSKVTGNFLVNALHAFHRFNRRYHVKKVGYFCNRVVYMILKERNNKGQHRKLCSGVSVSIVGAELTP